MRILFLLSILLSIDAERIASFENILLKQNCGKLFNSGETNFPPWLLSVRMDQKSKSLRFTGVVVSKNHIVVQVNNFFQNCTRNRQDYNGTELRKEDPGFANRFKVARKQCYHDEERECDFKAPSNISLKGWCNDYSELEGTLILEMGSDSMFDATSPICLPAKYVEKAPRLPNDTAIVYWGQFPKKPKNGNKGVYNSTVTPFLPLNARYKTPVYEKMGGSVVTEENGKAILIGFEPGQARDTDGWKGKAIKAYRMENYMTDILEILCNFSGVCPLGDRDPPKTTQITVEQNKDLKSNCGKIYDPVNTDAQFPSWLYTVYFNRNRVSGVILSHKHIIVQAEILLKEVECVVGEDENITRARILHHYYSGDIRVATTQCYEMYYDECNFSNITGMVYFGKCASTQNGPAFQGSLLLEIQESFDTMPICLPREKEVGFGEYDISEGLATVSGGDYPNSVAEGKYVVAKYEYQLDSDGNYVTNSASIGTGGALINDFEGRTYFLGFAPGSKSADSSPNAIVQERSWDYFSELCKEAGICVINGFKPESLIPTTPTPISTVPIEPSTKKAKKKNPKKNKNGKEQLPFEYDQEDFIYWPEETTKTAKWKGTLWVTVTVMFLLL